MMFIQEKFPLQKMPTPPVCKVADTSQYDVFIQKVPKMGNPNPMNKVKTEV